MKTSTALCGLISGLLLWAAGSMNANASGATVRYTGTWTVTNVFHLSEVEVKAGDTFAFLFELQDAPDTNGNLTVSVHASYCRIVFFKTGGTGSWQGFQHSSAGRVLTTDNNVVIGDRVVVQAFLIPPSNPVFDPALLPNFPGFAPAVENIFSVYEFPSPSPSDIPLGLPSADRLEFTFVDSDTSSLTLTNALGDNLYDVLNKSLDQFATGEVGLFFPQFDDGDPFNAPIFPQIDGDITSIAVTTLPAPPDNFVATIESAVEFRFTTMLGETYRIESSMDMSSWTVVETGIAGTGAEIARTYTTDDIREYYRAVRE